MNVRQFRQSMAHLIIDCTLADFTAFNMGDWNTQRNRSCGRRKHLITVRDQQQQVGTPCAESVRKAEDSNSDGFGHARIRIGAEQALDPRLNMEAVILDFLNRSPELGRKMWAENKDAQVDFRAS